MSFAIAMSLVILISTAVLLYQFWTGSLAGSEREATPAAPRARTYVDASPPIAPDAWPSRREAPRTEAA